MEVYSVDSLKELNYTQRKRNMLSLKETKTNRGMDANSLTLSSPPANDVDTIINPSSNNQTISIIIPLSAQLSTISSRVAEPPCKDDDIEENKAASELNVHSHQSQNGSQNEEAVALTISHGLSPVQSIKGRELVSWLNGYRADKTKGCPFPSCSRYGRAFSRAHDLKRHIARHETRKERLIETNSEDNYSCPQCGESFSNETILQRHTRLHTKSLEFHPPASPESTRIYSCGICNKKYTHERKLKVHLTSHDKKSERHMCPLCDCQFEQEEMLQNHMRDHTASIEPTQQDFNKVNDKSTQVKDEEDDDEFLLEEMLLLNKKPRIHESSGRNHTSDVATSSTSASSSSSSTLNGGNSKIRCDYCSKTFKTKWTLSSHVAAHEGRFQFGCARCGKKFVRKSHFEGHVRSHEAARPYVCEQCGKTFKELKHRREHTKRKHPGNRNAIQNLFDSISACVSEESTVEQAKFTLLMPINFGA